MYFVWADIALGRLYWIRGTSRSGSRGRRNSTSGGRPKSEPLGTFGRAIVVADPLLSTGAGGALSPAADRGGLGRRRSTLSNLWHRGKRRSSQASSRTKSLSPSSAASLTSAGGSTGSPTSSASFTVSSLTSTSSGEADGGGNGGNGEDSEASSAEIIASRLEQAAPRFVQLTSRFNEAAASMALKVPEPKPYSLGDPSSAAGARAAASTNHDAPSSSGDWRRDAAEIAEDWAAALTWVLAQAQQ